MYYNPVHIFVSRSAHVSQVCIYSEERYIYGFNLMSGFWIAVFDPHCAFWTATFMSVDCCIWPLLCVLNCNIQVCVYKSYLETLVKLEHMISSGPAFHGLRWSTTFVYNPKRYTSYDSTDISYMTGDSPPSHDPSEARTSLFDMSKFKI